MIDAICEMINVKRATIIANCEVLNDNMIHGMSKDNCKMKHVNWEMGNETCDLINVE